MEEITQLTVLHGDFKAGSTMAPKIEEIASNSHQQNYKAVLQQHAQKMMGGTPIYELLDEKGPDHSKCFKMVAQVSGQRYQPAWGRNKKEAEQRAACNALSELKSEAAPFPSD